MIPDDGSMDRPIGRRRGRAVGILVGVAAVLVVAGVMVQPTVGRWSQAERSVQRSRLRFGEVLRGDLVYDFGVQGRAVAASNPTLYSPAQGIVTIRVKEGELIRHRQVLAVVDSPELENRLRQERAGVEALRSDLGRQELRARQTNLENQQQVELLRVRLQAAERALERADQLADLGLVNAIEHETARDEVTIASLELRQAQQKVELEQEALRFELEDARLRVERQKLVVEEVERQVTELEMRSPCDGQIATLSVEDRDAVVRGQAVVSVVDLTALEVEVSIPEGYADDVTPGLEAVILFNSTEYPGRLTRIAPEVRESQVAGRVAFTEAVPHGLRQNQRLSTRLILDHRPDVLKVPRGPFLESGGGRQVYVVEDGLARLRQVELGVVSVTEVEVISGLDDNDTIVLSDMQRFEGAHTILLRN